MTLSVKINEQSTQAGFYSRSHPGQDVFYCMVVDVQPVCLSDSGSLLPSIGRIRNSMVDKYTK